MTETTMKPPSPSTSPSPACPSPSSMFALSRVSAILAALPAGYTDGHLPAPAGYDVPRYASEHLKRAQDPSYFPPVIDSPDLFENISGTILGMARVEGMTLAEIAETFGCSPHRLRDVSNEGFTEMLELAEKHAVAFWQDRLADLATLADVMTHTSYEIVRRNLEARLAAAMPYEDAING